jgi:rSAM-associated Gly-rich repeat protein
MISSRRLLRSLSVLLPLGAFGVSVALAAAPAKPITESDTGKPGIAVRLAAIRDAVSQVTAEQSDLEPDDPDIVKAWWGNWSPGWGNGGWRNWRNGWNNWRNGWGNGGWHNWPNFWRNW